MLWARGVRAAVQVARVPGNVVMRECREARERWATRRHLSCEEVNEEVKREGNRTEGGRVHAQNFWQRGRMEGACLSLKPRHTRREAAAAPAPRPAASARRRLPAHGNRGAVIGPLWRQCYPTREHLTVVAELS